MSDALSLRFVSYMACTGSLFFFDSLYHFTFRLITRLGDGPDISYIGAGSGGKMICCIIALIITKNSVNVVNCIPIVPLIISFSMCYSRRSISNTAVIPVDNHIRFRRFRLLKRPPVIAFISFAATRTEYLSGYELKISHQKLVAILSTEYAWQGTQE